MIPFRIIPDLSTSSVEIGFGEGHVIRPLDPVSLPHVVKVHSKVADREEEFFRETDDIGGIREFFWLWDISDRIGSISNTDLGLLEIIKYLMQWSIGRSKTA
jgi:hypothetical protein